MVSGTMQVKLCTGFGAVPAVKLVNIPRKQW